MVSHSFNINLVLVVVLLVLRQQHTSAHSLCGKLRKKEWVKFTSMHKDDDNSVDCIIASAGGIRKLLVYQFSSKAMKQEQMTDDISGDASFDSMKTSHMNAQVDSQIFEKNAWRNHKRSKKKESEEFVNPEDEVAKLTTKDYGGKLGPRRKPPVNNHKPTG